MHLRCRYKDTVQYDLGLVTRRAHLEFFRDETRRDGLVSSRLAILISRDDDTTNITQNYIF